MAAYSTSFTVPAALKIDNDSVLRIISLLSRYISSKPASISISFQGNHEISASDWQDIIQDPLFEAARVRSLSISNSDHKNDIDYLRVELSDRLRGVGYFSCSGSKSLCIACRQDFERFFQSRRPWYNVLYRFKWLILVGFGLLTFAGMSSILTWDTQFSRYSTSGSWSINVSILVYWIITALCPKLILEFGRNALFESAKYTILRFVFGSLITATVVGLIVNWLSSRLQ